MAVATWSELPGRTDIYETAFETANGGGFGGFLANGDSTLWLELKRPCAIRWSVLGNNTWTTGNIIILASNQNVTTPDNEGIVIATPAAVANSLAIAGGVQFSHSATGELIVPHRYLAVFWGAATPIGKASVSIHHKVSG
jgi:hypothetical protein